MLNSEFENRVQQKMEELKLGPTDEVWENIERNLPKEKKPRRWLLYMVLLGILTLGFLLIRNNSKDAQNQMLTTTSKQNKSTAGNKPMPGANESVIEYGPTPEQTPTGVVSVGQLKPTAEDTNGIISPSVNAVGTEAGHRTNLTPTHKRRLSAFNEDGRTRPIATDATGDKNNSVAKKLTPGVGKSISRTDSNAAVGLKNSHWSGLIATLAMQEPVHNFPDSMRSPARAGSETSSAAMPITKSESPVATTSKAQPRQTASGNWQYSFEIGGGLSNQVNGLFTNRPVLADGLSYSPGSVSNPGIAIRPNEPSSSAAFSAGLYMERSLSDKWKFLAGLTYVYQASVVKTGSRVDSSATYSVGNTSVAANSFYMPGTMEEYKNKSHFVDVPLLLRYSLSSKFPVYLEAGPGVSYLVSSNILLYNRGANAYFSSPAAYNKLLFSFSAGAGLELNRQKQIPFRLGYRFSYGINSITKEPFGNQQMQRSIFYLGIPIKK